MEERLLILGVSHHTAPVKLRERLGFDEGELIASLGRLRECAPSLAEAAVLSTCNRVEIVALVADPVSASAEALAFLASEREVDVSKFQDSTYRLEGREAIRHLFRVAASLDSMVVGEPQILGQVKLAYALAAEAGTVGLVLHRAFHKAFSVAKRVRKATLIGHGAVSVGSTAVRLANQIFDKLNDKTVMLMGAGEMAELVARQLKQLGIEALLITNRTFERAFALARELGATAVPFEQHRPYLKLADVVIGSLAGTRPILTTEEFEPLLHERRYRPIFLIDMGVPRNFDERLNSLDNVYLYDIDDLGALVAQSRGEREREAQQAEAIVELEVESFCKWLKGLDLVAAIKDIRLSIEGMRELELSRHRPWLNALAPPEREKVELLARALMNKLLHRVLSGLKRGGASFPNGAYAADIARRLLCEEAALKGADGAGDDDREDEGL